MGGAWRANSRKPLVQVVVEEGEEMSEHAVFLQRLTRGCTGRRAPRGAGEPQAR